jgi:hypothetical protein
MARVLINWQINDSDIIWFSINFFSISTGIGNERVSSQLINPRVNCLQNERELLEYIYLQW